MNAQLKYNNCNKQNTTKFFHDDDDTPSGSLGFYTKQLAISRVTVPLDEEIKAPSYYRHVVQGISDLTSNDSVVFRINSNGGNAEGMISILTAITATDALCKAEIYGNCHSAASMIALSCDTVHVSPYASMMVHFVSYGSAGKASDIMRHVTHTQSSMENIFREIYEGFLSEEEIEDCLNGMEFWFDSDQIILRLNAREEYRALLEEEAEKEKEVLPENTLPVIQSEDWSKAEPSPSFLTSSDIQIFSLTSGIEHTII